jgi:hypothetical protein
MWSQPLFWAYCSIGSRLGGDGQIRMMNSSFGGNWLYIIFEPIVWEAAGGGDRLF